MKRGILHEPTEHYIALPEEKDAVIGSIRKRPVWWWKLQYRKFHDKDGEHKFTGEPFVLISTRQRIRSERYGNAKELAKGVVR